MHLFLVNHVRHAVVSFDGIICYFSDFLSQFCNLNEQWSLLLKFKSIKLKQVYEEHFIIK